MPWGNIEERLLRPFDTRSPSTPGAILYPSQRLNLDQWLVGVAETDEELSELDIPRLRFVENRWPMEKLSEFDWVYPASVTRRFIWAMYVGHRTYVVYSGGFKYWLIAEIERRADPVLHSEVLHKLLSNADLVPEPPTLIRHFRPDLFAHEDQIASDGVPDRPSTASNQYMASMLLGWIDLWLRAPTWQFSCESIEQLRRPR